VGGFITIGKQFDTQWNWQRFWGFTAFLSIMLAFLNILPIPALDGGHVVFVLWEMVTGRKPAEKVLEYAQLVGFVILLALIVLANGNDIIGLFTG
jgi:regulator of sigma E protease